MAAMRLLFLGCGLLVGFEHGLAQFGAGVKSDNAARLNRHKLSRAWVASRAGRLVAQMKVAQAWQFDLLPLHQIAAQDGKKTIHSSVRFTTPHARQMFK